MANRIALAGFVSAALLLAASRRPGTTTVQDRLPPYVVPVEVRRSAPGDHQTWMSNGLRTVTGDDVLVGVAAAAGEATVTLNDGDGFSGSALEIVFSRSPGRPEVRVRGFWYADVGPETEGVLVDVSGGLIAYGAEDGSIEAFRFDIDATELLTTRPGTATPVALHGVVLLPHPLPFDPGPGPSDPGPDLVHRTIDGEGSWSSEGWVDELGRRQGFWVGRLGDTTMTVCEYRDGRREGHCMTWSGEGTLRSSGRLQAGLQDGPWRYYFPSGVPERLTHFASGVERGPFEEWWPGGAPRSTGRSDGTEEAHEVLLWDRSGKRR